MVKHNETKITRKSILWALAGALFVFLVNMAINAYMCYDFVYWGGCLCPMCLDCSCSCGTLSLYKECFFNPIAWLISFVLGLCVFVCLLPKFRYSKLVKLIPLVILGIYFIAVIAILIDKFI